MLTGDGELVLMSSWRDFDKDLEWSWLRVLETSSLLKLEPFEEQQDLCELIVAPDWPTLVSSVQTLEARQVLMTSRTKPIATTDLMRLEIYTSVTPIRTMLGVTQAEQTMCWFLAMVKRHHQATSKAPSDHVA